ncbi:cytochrome P450 [Pseudomonas corrugata]|uniref:cytochrome P450 n=1 Tax=Pseudomonas corrugata TaxID=47879 RepID=UPI0015869618|nr:cytochrome P450 [Pseudomonas corrugata]MCI0995636.1 cytochrome P450 [Pseudomonas corrugata]NUT64687.1 cytochrome P450 [Pseudomonas corrugata]
MQSAKSTIPAHIPAERVFDFDILQAAELKHCPHHNVANALHGQRPPIFYTPRNGGHWVISGAEMAADILAHPELFSSNSTRYDPNLEPGVPHLIPLMEDPPEHAKYRRLINPLFSPARTAAIEDKVRATARRLVESVKAEGSCEFVAQIAKFYSVSIFLEMCQIPDEQRETFMGWVEDISRASTPEAMGAGYGKLFGFMHEKLAERRANPGDDLLSTLIQGQIDGQPVPEQAALSMCATVFIGGMDTVVSLLSFIMHYLAEHPVQRQAVAAQREEISNEVVDELLRHFGVANIRRLATGDFSYKGIDFKCGERLVILTPVLNLDPSYSEAPQEVDFTRKQPLNLIFGSGPHRCPGAPLARFEVRVFLEEWFKVIPEFGLKPGTQVEVGTGLVWCPLAVPLAWTA